MDDYIKRSQIKYSYITKRFAEHSELCRAYNDGVKSMELHIAEIPAADVVEVVRCKDCKYGRAMNKREAELYVEGCVMCNRISVSGEENAMFATDFCSYGEAKMDGKGDGK